MGRDWGVVDMCASDKSTELIRQLNVSAKIRHGQAGRRRRARRGAGSSTPTHAAPHRAGRRRDELGRHRRARRRRGGDRVPPLPLARRAGPRVRGVSMRDRRAARPAEAVPAAFDGAERPRRDAWSARCSRSTSARPRSCGSRSREPRRPPGACGEGADAFEATLGALIDAAAIAPATAARRPRAARPRHLGVAAPPGARARGGGRGGDRATRAAGRRPLAPASACA